MTDHYGLGRYYPTHWRDRTSGKTVEAICAASYSNDSVNGQLITVFRDEGGMTFAVEWAAFNMGEEFVLMQPEERDAWLRLREKKP